VSLEGHDDVVDRDVHQLDEETYEAHDEEALSRRSGDFQEFW